MAIDEGSLAVGDVTVSTKKLRTAEQTTSEGLVQLEVVAIGDPETSANVAKVNAAGGLNVDLSALSAWQAGQVAVGLTQVQIASTPLALRRSISIKAICTTAARRVYLGNSAAVTSANGFALADAHSLNLDIGPGANVFAVASDATGCSISFAETAGSA